VYGTVVLPALYVSGKFGGHGGVELPLFTISARGYLAPDADASISLGRLTIFGGGVTGQSGAGSIALPVLSFSGVGYYKPSGAGAVVLPSLIVNSLGYNVEVYKTVVLNTQRSAVSNYLGYSFNSMCEFPKGSFIGAGMLGIYNLLGTSGLDNGSMIPAELELGTTDFGEQVHKYCVDGYVNYRGGGNLEILSLVDEMEDPDVFNVTAVADGRLRNYKFKMSRFRRGKNWRFSVRNVDGSDLDINELVVFYEALSRRI
jgi:hypothetical protein